MCRMYVQCVCRGVCAGVCVQSGAGVCVQSVCAGVCVQGVCAGRLCRGACGGVCVQSSAGVCVHGVCVQSVCAGVCVQGVCAGRLCRGTCAAVCGGVSARRPVTQPPPDSWALTAPSSQGARACLSLLQSSIHGSRGHSPGDEPPRSCLPPAAALPGLVQAATSRRISGPLLLSCTFAGRLWYTCFPLL